MKIAFNPSTVAALTSPPNNTDITFDLKGRNIFARGVKFSGTDTQVNVIDNLTSTDTSSALSANMGRLLNLIKTPYNNTSTPSSAPSAYNIEICPSSSSWYSSLGITDSGGGLLIRGHTGTAFNLWLHDTSNVWYKQTASGAWKKMDAGNSDTLEGHSASYFATNTHNHDGRYSYAHQSSFAYNVAHDSNYVTFDDSSNSGLGWVNGFVSTHNNYLSSYILNVHRTNLWYVGYSENSTAPTSWHRLALFSEIPTSLKNPYTLTILTNGNSLGSYDGSEAKTWNITYSNVGAAAASHNHTSLSGVTRINFNSDASDSCYIGTTVSAPSTHLDFYLSDDAALESYRWIFADCNSAVGTKTIMELLPTNNANTALKLYGSYVATQSWTNGLYVTSLGTSGRNLTWIKNGTTNNITVPFATYSSALKSTGDDGNWYNWVYWNGSYFWLKAGTSIYDNNTATLKTAVDYSTMASYVIDNGVHAETSSGTTANATNAGMLYPSGMYMTRTYAAGNMPTSYGNVLNLAGGGSSLLLLGWSGSDSTTGNIYYRSHRDTNSGGWGAWATILATNNYAGILDSRYYTESEVNTLLGKKLDRVNLTTGGWNPRGYNLAADYHYNGGDVSFAESGGQMHVSIDGKFWLNEGQYKVLDTSDLNGVYSNQTLALYLSSSDTTWWPIVWGGSPHASTSNTTGQLYKSYSALTWQTSSLTLKATKIATNLININSMSSLYLGNDNSPTVGGALSNLVIQTWYGVSFTSNCCGTYAGKTGVGIDARYGIIRAANYEGNWHGYINQLSTNNTSDTWVPVLNNSYLLHRVIPTAYNNDPSTLNVNSALYLSTVKFGHGPDSNTWHKILTFTTNWVGQVTFMYAPEECQRYYWFIGLINVRNGDPYFFITACTGTYPTMKVIGTDSTHWELWIKGNSGSYDPYGALSILSFSNASITGRGIMASLTSEPSGTYTKTPSNYLNAYISNYVRDYNDSTHVILIGFRGSGLTTSNLGYLAGYTSDGNSIKDVSKDVLKSWIGIDNYYWANIKISTSSNTQTQPSVNTIYANNWFRSQGSTGWYSLDYGGGIYMYDSNWVRVFNNKGFYTGNEIQANLFRANNGNGCYLFGNNNAKISHINDQVIFNTGAAIRFGSTAWDWNLWAGFKYNSSNKCIYLGIADGSIFTANSSLSGGSINLQAGVGSLYIPLTIYSNASEVHIGYSNSYNDPWSGLGVAFKFGGTIGARDIYSNGGFHKNGSNDSYVLTGGGGHSLISNLTVANAYHLRINSANTWSNWYWSGQGGQPSWLWGSNDGTNMYVWNPSNFSVNYAKSAGNADTLDGYHANPPGTLASYGKIPVIGTDGVIEIGKHIDFHDTNSGRYDYSTRLQSTGDYRNTVKLPSGSGTLALTSLIPSVPTIRYAIYKINANGIATPMRLNTYFISSASRSTTGHYRIDLNSYVSSYKMFIWGSGESQENRTTDFLYVTIYRITDYLIFANTADDASANDGYFYLYFLYIS